MARPRKTGLDYFPFDCDFFEDEKIVSIAGEFGIKGELTAIKLLCAIYHNGYFIEWNEALKFKMLRQLPGVSADLFDQILNRLVRWGFFDASLFDSVKVLTSVGIQRRYFEVVRKRNILENYPFLLVSAPKTPVSAPKTPQIKEKKIKEKKSPYGDSKKGVSIPGLENAGRRSKNKRAREGPYVPTLDEVLSYFQKHEFCPPDWDLQARLFYSHYDGLGWKNAAGTTVERWDSMANHWILKLKLKNHEQTTNGRPSGPSNGVPIRGQITPGYGLQRDDT